MLSVLSAVVLVRLLPAEKRRDSSPQARAWIELSKQQLYQNVDALSQLLPPGCQLMPAVKANAYGHGAVLIAKALQEKGIRAFCVASVTEGVELRKNGITGTILILGYTHPDSFPLLWKYRLTQTVVDYPYAQSLNACRKKVQVHLKIDTGMHRLGIRSDHIEEISRMFQMDNLLVDGIYTPHRIIWRKPPQMVGIWENGKKIYKIYMEDISRLFPLPSTRREQTQMCVYCGRNQQGGKRTADILADLSNTDAEPGNCS